MAPKFFNNSVNKIYFQRIYCNDGFKVYSICLGKVILRLQEKETNKTF